jgi:hypothetical protein
MEPQWIFWYQGAYLSLELWRSKLGLIDGGSNIIPRDIGWRFITTHDIFGYEKPQKLKLKKKMVTSAMSKDHLANPDLANPDIIGSKIYSGFQSGQSHKRATMVVQGTVPELMWALPNGTKIMTQHLECFDNMMQFLRIKFGKIN